MAHRIFRDYVIEGCFSGNHFYIYAEDPKIDFQTIARALVQTRIQSLGDVAKEAIQPVQLNDFEIVLDWWLDERGKKTDFKIWAGNQKAIKIVQDMRDAIKMLINADPEGVFDFSVPLSGRFGFDPRSAWSALDSGFSPNEQKIKVVTYPAVELFAAIGLQRFRPVKKLNKARQHIFGYSTWSVPISATVANAAAASLFSVGYQLKYEFSIVSRGNYKAFSYANKVEG